MRTFIAVLTALLLASSPALAAGEPECSGNWDRGSAALIAKGWAVHELRRAQRIVFMNDFNGRDPKTEWVVDHVYVLTAPQKPVTLVILVKEDDCVLDAVPLPPEALQQILHGADDPA